MKKRPYMTKQIADFEKLVEKTERDSITRRSMAAQQFVTVLEHWEDLYPERSE